MTKPDLQLVDGVAHPGNTLAQRSDDDLMALCRAGHKAAFQCLLERYEGLIVGFSAKFLGNRTLAEEATQETFVALWTLRERYRSEGRFKAYLCKLCLNRCRGIARSARRRHDGIRRFESSLPTPPADEDGLLLREREQQMEKTIARLPEKLRSAVLLRFYSDLDYSEMSKSLGGSEVAMRARIHKSLLLLRKMIHKRVHP